MIWIGYISLAVFFILYVLFMRYHIKYLIKESRRIKAELAVLKKRELVFKSRANKPGYTSKGEPIIRHIANMF